MLAWQAQLPVGAFVPVHYDPTNPQESYLIYTESVALRSYLITGIVLLLLGVGLIVIPRLAT